LSIEYRKHVLDDGPDASK